MVHPKCLSRQRSTVCCSQPEARAAHPAPLRSQVRPEGVHESAHRPARGPAHLQHWQQGRPVPRRDRTKVQPPRVGRIL